MFYENINDAIKEELLIIERKRMIIKEVKEKPELILTELFDSSLTYPEYDIFFKIIEKHKKYKTHEQQAELFGLIKPYLESLDKDIEVELDNLMNFPSSCSIKFNGRKLIIFDFYRHLYEIYKIPFAVESFLGSEINYKKSMEKELEKWEKRNEDMYSWIKEASKEQKGLLRRWWFLIENSIIFTLKKKTVKENLLNQISDSKDALARIEKSVNDYQEQLEKEESIKPLAEEKIRFWRQVFEDKFGYKEKIKHIEG